MSSLSNLPYGKILDYWYEKLKGNKYRTKFLLTKAVEVFTFKSSGESSNKKDAKYIEFPVYKAVSLSEIPQIAIVIPVYISNNNDIININNLFTSILQQTCKPNNVIIIDDNSPLEYKVPNEFYFQRMNKNSGPAKARNIGKQIALRKNTDIIAFTDSDCLLNIRWTEIIIDSFKEHLNTAHIMSGNTISYDEHWFGQYHNINGTLNGRKIKGSDRLLYGTTANLAMLNIVAEKLDFNEKFPLAAGEDIEFCFRANEKGFVIKHNKKMEVLHNYGYTSNKYKSFNRFRYLFKKYGKGENTLLKEIPNYYVYFDQTEEITI